MTLRRRSLLLCTTACFATSAIALPALPRQVRRIAEASVGIEEVGAVQLLQALAEGRITSAQLVRRCMARIAAIDRAGPRLNSVIALNPDAERIAIDLDRERRDGRLRGALHGLPVLLKDNIATGDRMPTTVGSLALAGVRAERDAHLVTRLRKAGAVILGKTNLSEWANIRSSRSVSGWSGAGGLTRNPYALDRSTSGSSAGTAAALAASLAPLGVGTETDGSIVSPASINGLVGLKPTVGRISRDGIAPISHSQDTAGAMARSVADAALLHAAMAGPDSADPATLAAGAGAGANASATPIATTPVGVSNLSRDALRGARVGIARNYLSAYDRVNAVFDNAVEVLRAQGAQVVDDIELPAPTWNDAEMSVLLHELKHDLPLWLQGFVPTAPVKTLEDVIAFNAAHSAAEMRWFRQELFEKAQALGGLDEAAYLEARAACLKSARDDGLQKALDRFQLDAIIAPTGGVAWLIDPIGGDNFGDAGFAGPAAVAGYPHLTVPAGFVEGLPVGLSFVGRPFEEWRLLNLGYAFEQATHHRRAPRYLERSESI